MTSQPPERGPNTLNEPPEFPMESLSDPCRFMPKGLEQIKLITSHFINASNKISEILTESTAHDALTNPFDYRHRTFIEFFVANEVMQHFKLRPALPITRQFIAQQVSKKTQFDYSLFAMPEPVLDKYTGLQATPVSEGQLVSPATLEANKVLTRIYRGYQSYALGLDPTIDTRWLVALCDRGIITQDNPLHPYNRPKISLLAK